MKNDKSFVYASAVFLLYALVYLFVKDEGILTPVNDIALVVVTLVAAFLGYSAAKIYGWGSADGKIFYILSAGVFLLFLGEVSWMAYEVILRVEVPYPSIADAFWLSGLAVVCVALYMKVFSSAVREQLAASRIATAAVVSIALLVPCILLVLLPILSAPPGDFGGGWVEQAIDLAYPLEDIVAMFGAMGIYATHRRGALGKTWGFIIAALLMRYAFDVSFSYLTWNDLYSTGHPVDLFYFAQYLLLALGFQNQIKQFKE